MKKGLVVLIIVAILAIVGILAYGFLVERSGKLGEIKELDRSFDLAEEGADELGDASDELNKIVSKGMMGKFKEQEDLFEIEDNIKAANSYFDRALKIAKQHLDSKYEDVSTIADDLVETIKDGQAAVAHFDNAYEYLMKNNFGSARSELVKGNAILRNVKISLEDLEYSIEKIGDQIEELLDIEIEDD
jgi:hypothetical protein